MVKIRLNFVAVSTFSRVSLHVVLIGNNQNDKLKKENPDFRFHSLYPHVPLCVTYQEKPYKVDTIQDFLFKLGMKPHTYASSGNKHFFTKSCHHQTYQNY